MPEKMRTVREFYRRPDGPQGPPESVTPLRRQPAGVPAPGALRVPGAGAASGPFLVAAELCVSRREESVDGRHRVVITPTAPTAARPGAPCPGAGRPGG